jgi:hypothetical protein
MLADERLFQFRRGCRSGDLRPLPVSQTWRVIMAKKKAVAMAVIPPPIQWRWGEPPVDRRAIEQAATQWGVLFPEDYILLAQQHHGARPTLKTINIPARSGSVFQSLLSYRTRPRLRDDDMSIFETWNALAKQLPPKIIPFGNDPFGNLFCFDYRGGDHTPKCVFWDHEKARKNLDKAVIPVCDTVTQLIEMLY